MDNKLPKETVEAFDALVRGLSTAVKNSALYNTSHPVLQRSIQELKDAVDNWFGVKKSLIIGISQDNILLNDSYVREESDIYAELAEYLHRRGIMVMTVMPGVDVEELSTLMEALKEDDRKIRDSGGLSAMLPRLANIKIKALDYSRILGRAGDEITDEDEDVWRSLCSIGEDKNEGGLPMSKEEFLKGFLKNSSRSAKVLNKMYKQALAQMEDNSTVEDIRATMARIARYFSEKPGQETDDNRQELAGIIGKLDPELVVKIFEAGGQDSESGLIKEIMGDMSDDTISGMISSIISGEGGFNESLLKLFDRMMPKNDAPGNIASLVADNLLQKTLMDKDAISGLKSSIKELAKTHPENNFMSEMYRITVDSFVSEKIDATLQENAFRKLVDDLKESFDENAVLAARIKLILNLAWIEDDPAELEKLIVMITEPCEQASRTGNVGALKYVLQFFDEYFPKKENVNENSGKEAEKILSIAGNDRTAGNIIKVFSGADEKAIKDMGYVISRLSPEGRGRVVDAFLLEDDPFTRDKYMSMFRETGTELSGNIEERLKCEDHSTVKRLLKVLKAVDPERAVIAANDLLANRDAQVRLEALGGISLSDPDGPYRDVVMKIFTGDKSDAVREQAMTVLMESGDPGIMDEIFDIIEKKRSMNKYLLPFVRLCGNKKMKEAVPDLEKVLFKKALFDTQRTDELRIAAIVALGQIRTPEAMDVIRKGAAIKREAVSNMCGVVLKLEEHERNSGQE